MTELLSLIVGLIGVFSSAFALAYSGYKSKRALDLSNTYHKTLMRGYQRLLQVSLPSVVSTAADRKVSDEKRRQLQETMSDIISNAAKTMTESFGREIHASVRLFVNGDHGLEIYVVARDNFSVSERYKIDVRDVTNQKRGQLNNFLLQFFTKKDIKSHNILLISDIEKQNIVENLNADEAIFYRALLAVPLVQVDTEEQFLFGVLVFDSPIAGSFPPDFVDFANSVAAMLTRTLTNYRDKLA